MFLRDLHENKLKWGKPCMFKQGISEGERDKAKIILCCSGETSMPKRSYMILCKWFLGAWRAEDPNSATVLALSGFWPYQLFFHYWMLWQTFQTDTRKERFLTWISLSVNSLFWIGTLLCPLYVKGGLGCTRCVRNVLLKRSSSELWRWNKILCRPSQREHLPFYSLKKGLVWGWG